MKVPLGPPKIAGGGLTHRTALSTADELPSAPDPLPPISTFQEVLRIVSPSRPSDQALFNAGIHCDNARNTLQILAFDGSDRPAILSDVARSIVRAEQELSHSSHGSITGEENGITATYRYEEVKEELAGMKRQVMRELRRLSIPERVAILHLLNPHNQSSE